MPLTVTQSNRNIVIHVLTVEKYMHSKSTKNNNMALSTLTAIGHGPQLLHETVLTEFHCWTNITSCSPQPFNIKVSTLHLTTLQSHLMRPCRPACIA